MEADVLSMDASRFQEVTRMQFQTSSLWLLFQVVCMLPAFAIPRLNPRKVRVRAVRRSPHTK